MTALVAVPRYGGAVLMLACGHSLPALPSATGYLGVWFNCPQGCGTQLATDLIVRTQ